jgi:hypothetical protein
MSIVTLNNRAVKDATTVGSFSGLGNLIFISRSTASSSSSLSITSNIDSTYKEYIFMFNNIHPQTDEQPFEFNLSSDGGSNYNITKTTSIFRAQHLENGSSQVFDYLSSEDLAQSTSYQHISNLCGNDADQCVSGYLHLFAPSNSTFVKHFYSNINSCFTNSEASANLYMGGYANTTSAINAINFQFASGNIDSGTIDMYGVL